MLSGEFVQSRQQCSRRQPATIDRNGVAAFKPDFNIFRGIGGGLGSDGAAEHKFFGFGPRVLEDFPFRRDMQQIGINRKRRFAPLVARDRDLLPVSIIEEPSARRQIPLAPRGDDFDIGGERVITKFEADLVVTFAGGAMSDRVGTDLSGDIDLAFGDQRPGDRCTEQVSAFVERVGAKHRKDEVADEFFAQIVDKDLRGAKQLGLPPCRLQFLALTEIGGEGDDLAAVGFLQPTQDDRGVEPARIGKHHFFHRIRHDRPSPVRMRWLVEIDRRGNGFGDMPAHSALDKRNGGIDRAELSKIFVAARGRKPGFFRRGRCRKQFAAVADRHNSVAFAVQNQQRGRDLADTRQRVQNGHAPATPRGRTDNGAGPQRQCW